MTTWTHRTIIVPAALVEQARELGAALDAAGAGMYSCPLSATGQLPATHWASAGMIDEKFAAILHDAIALHYYAQQGAKAQGLTLKTSLVDAVALVAASVVSEEPAFGVLDAHGLKMIQEEMQ